MTAGAGSGVLTGGTVLVTRARDQAAQLSGRLRALGARVIEAPTIRILPGDTAALEAAVREIASGGYAAVALTSPNGVTALAGAFDAAAVDRAALREPALLVASLGPGTTAALEEHFGRTPDLMPPDATTAAFGQVFPTGRGMVLLPCADLAATDLQDVLRAKGWQSIRIDAYVTAAPGVLADDVLERLGHGDVDVIVFTSASTARNFAALARGVAWSARVVSIGPVTSAACRDVSIGVTAEAATHDLDGVVAAVVDVMAHA